MRRRAEQRGDRCGDHTALYGEHAFHVGIGRDSELIGDHRAKQSGVGSRAHRDRCGWPGRSLVCP